MTTGRQSQVFQQLRQAVLARDGAGLTDAELMTHFVGQRDSAALEALIRRHGSMVWSVCRRVLSNEQDAEDAFQASFLVFVRKAASIRARQQVGNWLYGVAYRTALKARTTDARRLAKERRAAEMAQPQTEADAGWSDLLPSLDQELSRLPDKYRTAIVLCELEGRPRKEAARQLGIPEGTLSSRLATARRMLAKRLGRPGLALSAGALATAAAVVPAPLMASTVKAVSLVAAGQAVVAGVVSVRVAALAEGVVKAMFLSKLSAGAAVLMMVAVLAAGAGGVAYCAAAADPKPPLKAPSVAAVSLKGNNVDREEGKREESEWGQAVDGVQARIRTPKVIWKAGEAPTFTLDLRNQGKRTPHSFQVPFDCQIEVDGTWYTYGKPLSWLGPTEPTALEPGKQINDWVAVSPDDSWMNKDAKPPLGPKDYLSLPPGKHTIRIAYPFNGEKPALRPVSGPLEIEVGKESAWGEAVNGIQVRLRMSKLLGGAPGSRDFAVDVRNQGTQDASQCRVPNFCEVEWDGQWYTFSGRGELECKAFALHPGVQIDDWVKASLDTPFERLPDHKADDPPSIGAVMMKRLRVDLGKHTVRVAFVFNDKTRPISQLVEYEEGKESAWGEAVDGVQARIRVRKALWGPNETPGFHLDLRNQGKKTPDQRRVPLDCQIEVDKVWYSYDKPSGPYVTLGDLLQPGVQINDWTTVTPDKSWVSLTAEKKHFPLPPGKHTIRIAYQLQGTTPAIRPISGSIEIEISDKATVDGAKAPPTADTAPPAGDDNQTAARRAADIQKRLDEPIKYGLFEDIALDKALDELLVRQGIPWRINAPAFAKQGEGPNIEHKTTVAKIAELDGVSRQTIFERFLSNIESKSDDGKAVAVIRPDSVEITTRRAYLDEFYPGRKDFNLPPLVYATFDKVPLSEALAELRRTTGSNVILAGYLSKVAETKVTADLLGVPLDTALVLLADMADLKLVRLGNVYYVTSRERARLLETEEQERRLKEEKEEDVPAKPQADKAEPKK